MLNRIRSLFSPRGKESTPDVLIQGQSGRTLLAFLIRETQSCTLLNEQGKVAFKAYYARLLQTHEDNRTRDLKEKRAQASEAKRALLELLPSLLSEQGLETSHPGAIIGNLYSAAVIKKARNDALTKARNTTVIKTFSLHGCNDAGCIWCRENMGIEHKLTFNVEASLDEKCVCDPYCKCYVKASISL